MHNLLKKQIPDITLECHSDLRGDSRRAEESLAFEVLKGKACLPDRQGSLDNLGMTEHHFVNTLFKKLFLTLAVLCLALISACGSGSMEDTSAEETVGYAIMQAVTADGVNMEGLIKDFSLSPMSGGLGTVKADPDEGYHWCELSYSYTSFTSTGEGTLSFVEDPAECPDPNNCGVCTAQRLDQNCSLSCTIKALANPDLADEYFVIYYNYFVDFISYTDKLIPYIDNGVVRIDMRYPSVDVGGTVFPNLFARGPDGVTLDRDSVQYEIINEEGTGRGIFLYNFHSKHYFDPDRIFATWDILYIDTQKTYAPVEVIARTKAHVPLDYLTVPGVTMNMSAGNINANAGMWDLIDSQFDTLE